jgi:spore maturation protein CgeB
VRLVVFGLTISSSWGNGHATLWRGLVRALGRRGHAVTFFERDVPYYAATRDLTAMPPEVPAGRLVLYDDWSAVRERARTELTGCDAAIVTSYCPDALAASALVHESDAGARVFYDLDTPVTLDAVQDGRTPPWIGPRGLADFDLVLSFTGGRALRELHQRLGARRIAPLYGSVDPDVHRPVAPVLRYKADLSYLGTYADDRQEALKALFVEPARRRPAKRFVIAGAQYPPGFPWTDNIFFVRHLVPAEHPAFFSSSRLTLNVTRSAMVRMGHCPSGRLFEAAACGAGLVSDAWEGLDEFFTPGREILTARDTGELLAAMDRDDAELHALARAARERELDEHTAGRRAEQLVALLDDARAAVVAQADRPA